MVFAGNGFRLLPTSSDFCRFLPTFYCKFAVNFVYSEEKHYLCRQNVNFHWYGNEHTNGCSGKSE